ncbi:putative dynein light chain, type, dynein light chain superfamily protein [Dioscorea sansibarensis]
MFEEKGRVSRTDMPKNMQLHAMELAQKALELHKHSDCYSVARHIKQELDEAYGEAWNLCCRWQLWIMHHMFEWKFYLFSCGGFGISYF